MKDQIRIKGLEIYAHHGVFPEEKEKGQHFFVDAVLYTDTRKAGLTDDLNCSTDYGQVCKLIYRCMTAQTYDLIERAAEQTAQEVLLEFPLVERIELEMHKPEAPIPLPFKDVYVMIERGWHKAFIAFGSNMGDKEDYLEKGLKELKEHPLCREGKISGIYRTTPYGGVEQDDFLNGVLQLDTLLGPFELLEKMQQVEKQAGRERKVHWGPRTLDLDLLLYDDRIIDSETLTVPHPDMQNRDFVLVPLCEIAPFARNPATGRTVKQMLEMLQMGGERHVMDKEPQEA